MWLLFFFLFLFRNSKWWSFMQKLTNGVLSWIIIKCYTGWLFLYFLSFFIRLHYMQTSFGPFKILTLAFFLFCSAEFFVLLNDIKSLVPCIGALKTFTLTFSQVDIFSHFVSFVRFFDILCVISQQWTISLPFFFFFLLFDK